MSGYLKDAADTCARTVGAFYDVAAATVAPPAPVAAACEAPLPCQLAGGPVHECACNTCRAMNDPGTKAAIFDARAKIVAQLTTHYAKETADLAETHRTLEEGLTEKMDKLKKQVKGLQRKEQRAKSAKANKTGEPKKLRAKLARVKAVMEKYDSQQRERQDADQLNPNGKHFRGRIRSTRRHALPASVGRLLQQKENSNKQHSARKRFAGDKEMQGRMGMLLGKVITREEMTNAIKGDRFKTVRKYITQEYINSVGTVLTAECVTRGLDYGGGTGKCWQAVFGEMKDAFAEKGLKINGAVPCPHQQRQAREEMNKRFEALGAFSVDGH